LYAFLSTLVIFANSSVCSATPNNQDLVLFKEVLNIINKSFVEVPDTNKLICGAIYGLEDMLDSKYPAAICSRLNEGDIKEVDMMEEYRNVLTYFNNKFPDIGFEKLVPASIEGLVSRLDSSSSLVASKYVKQQFLIKGGFAGVGIEFAKKAGVLTVIAPFDDSPAFKAGIQPGDRLLKIGGESTKALSVLDVVSLLNGSPGSKVDLTVKRDGVDKLITVTLERAIIHAKSIKHRLLNSGVGYVRISLLADRTDDEMGNALQSLLEENGGRLHGLIVDLRNTPGGLLDQATKITSRFINRGQLIVRTEGRDKSKDSQFNATNDAKEALYPMIVLVNSGTASAGEVVSGSLQAHKRALVIGTHSFGKGSVPIIAPLGDGSALRLTVARYILPNGHLVQDGIVPDIESDGVEGVDAPLNLAQKILSKSSAVASFDEVMKVARDMVAVGSNRMEANNLPVQHQKNESATSKHDTGYATEIKNLTSGQSGERGFVQYDLVGKLGVKEADVTVFAEIGGERYPAGKLSLTGDFGAKVKVGTGRRFYWDFLKDYPAGFDGEVTWDVEAVGAPLAAPASAPAVASGSGFTDPTTGMEFVPVKGGCFQMGDTFGDGYASEKPVHEVCVDGFSIGKYEVTQGQWKAVMGNNPSKFSSCGDNCPVEQVSWNDVQDFIGKLNSRSGRNYRLPTEAEWEYAARSGGKSEKYSGSSSIDSVAWYGGWDGNSSSTTHVGRKGANGLGIYDMSGNVWEWCSDWYGEEYYGESPRSNPQGPSTGSGRVGRGGSWSGEPASVRASNRSNGSPSANRFSTLGFRLLAPVQ